MSRLWVWLVALGAALAWLAGKRWSAVPGGQERKTLKDAMTEAAAQKRKVIELEAKARLDKKRASDTRLRDALERARRERAGKRPD